MKKIRFVIAMGAAFSALAGASAQTPPPRQTGRPSTAQQKPPHVVRLSGSAADDLIVVATGTTGVDKAAVRKREERDTASYRIVSEGEAYFKAGNTQAAIASYKEALGITPNNGLSYRRMAEAYTAAGKLPEASLAFHKFLVEGFGPGNGNGGVGDTADEWAEYALVLVKTGQSAEAIRCYNHAAFLLDYEGSENHGGKPFLPVLFPEVVIGDALPDQVTYTPEHLQALADVLLAYKQQSFISDKEIALYRQEAARLYPDSAVTYYYLGETLFGPTHSAKAKAAYQKAAELGDDRTAAAAKERLKVLR